MIRFSISSWWLEGNATDKDTILMNQLGYRTSKTSFLLLVGLDKAFVGMLTMSCDQLTRLVAANQLRNDFLSVLLSFLILNVR